MKRLRILHISTRLILGGSQENTVLSCEGQMRLGHEVHLAFGPIYGPEGSMLDRVRAFHVTGRKIRTHEIQNLVREVNPIRDFRAQRELRRLIRTLQPDIVHTHSSKAGILGRHAAWRSGTGASPGPAIVHTIHGPPFMPVEGSGLARARIRIKNRLYTFAERRASKRGHIIVSVADAMTRTFLQRKIGRPEQYITVRSGMELDAFINPSPDATREASRAALGFAEGDFVVGTVARLAQHKGHDDLLDALAPEMQLDPSIRLLWVGDGWWRKRLERRIASLGLTDRVTLTGLVDPGRVPGLIRAMDTLAHPSSREGLPRTVPQALLCRVCPVAYDIDGAGEICRDMETGRLVAHGDVGALRDAILWLKANPGQRASLAEAGYHETEREFGAHTMVGKLEEVYADALLRRDQP